MTAILGQIDVGLTLSIAVGVALGLSLDRLFMALVKLLTGRA